MNYVLTKVAITFVNHTLFTCWFNLFYCLILQYMLYVHIFISLFIYLYFFVPNEFSGDRISVLKINILLFKVCKCIINCIQDTWITWDVELQIRLKRYKDTSKSRYIIWNNEPTVHIWRSVTNRRVEKTEDYYNDGWEKDSLGIHWIKP
jgi:hypothetical protein